MRTGLRRSAAPGDPLVNKPSMLPVPLQRETASKPLACIHRYPAPCLWRTTKVSDGVNTRRCALVPCSQCLAVHARAGMRVDTAAVQEMLWQVLPGALEGASVESLRRPWPELLKADGGTGLWWDK